MAYKFVVEEFKSIDDDNCEINTLSEDTGLSLITALELFKSFTVHHKNGYLLEGGGHPVEYETDGAKLSCWIDFDD